MKRVTTDQTLTAFKEIVKHRGRFPAMLTTDSGTEFTSNVFETFLDENTVIHHLAKPPLKAQVSGRIESAGFNFYIVLARRTLCQISKTENISLHECQRYQTLHRCARRNCRRSKQSVHQSNWLRAKRCQHSQSI